MHRNYFLIIAFLSVCALILIFFSIGTELSTPVIKEQPVKQPLSPFKTSISGVGIVEPSSENVLIGTPLNRIVVKVLATVGQKVKKGEVLFSLEDRDLKANLAVQQAIYESANAKLQKLQRLPRPEDLVEATASFNIAKAQLDLAKSHYDMVQGLTDPRAIKLEEKVQRLYDYQEAQAKVQQAQAVLDKVKEGTWKPDLEIAKLEVSETEANINHLKTEIDRTVIRSPIDGTVLQIRIHEGEFPPPDTFRTPMMILGNTDELYLRVTINQLDIPNFHKDAAATAYFQGDASTKFPLEFVRIEPYLISKQNLTNEITEKVDTRVLQIIYRIKGSNPNLFVGQQMDVFIATKSAS